MTMNACTFLTLLGLVAAVGAQKFRPVRSEGGGIGYKTGNWASAKSSSMSFNPATGETATVEHCNCMNIEGFDDAPFDFEEECLCDACGNCDPLEVLKREQPELFDPTFAEDQCGCIDDPDGAVTDGASAAYRTAAECECQECGICPQQSPAVGSSSGDPHFKTWTGDKYDYHGECDLVLVHNPSFAAGKGLRVHIRTTRVKYFSFIEKVAIAIGSDVLEFDNDVDNFLINGAKVEANKKHHKTKLSGFVVRRDKKAISIRLLHDEGAADRRSQNIAKIDLHTRKNGFPAVIVDGGNTDVFKGSLGLLGDWSTGKKLGRDGKTEFVMDDGDDATPFALEWQVRDDEPMLFQDARFPQYPTKCTPPAQVPAGRLGGSLFKKEAEEACAHWKHDFEDCVFDVVATRDVMVAAEGHIEHVE